jgi:hypothetical protein
MNQSFLTIKNSIFLFIGILASYAHKLPEALRKCLIPHFLHRKQIRAFIQQDSSVFLHPRPIDSLVQLHHINKLLPHRFVRSWCTTACPPVIRDFNDSQRD